MNLPLSRIVSWSHQLIHEVLPAGGCAVDLTAGNGYDTLMLAKCAGPTGRVLAFDLQEKAILNTAKRLNAEEISVQQISKPGNLPDTGVVLVHGSHAEIGDWRRLSPNAIIANLGYLPGGDKDLVTQPESTLKALEAGVDMLVAGGRLAVVVYHTHPGGRQEADAVEAFFSSLDEGRFEVLKIAVQNRPQAPYLLVAGKHA